MPFLTYLRTQWEYLLAVALLLVSSTAACWAAVDKQYGLAGMAALCAIGFFTAAVAFAEADAWRRVKEDAARRQQRAEDLDR